MVVSQRVVSYVLLVYTLVTGIKMVVKQSASFLVGDERVEVTFERQDQ